MLFIIFSKILSSLALNSFVLNGKVLRDKIMLAIANAMVWCTQRRIVHETILWRFSSLRFCGLGLWFLAPENMTGGRFRSTIEMIPAPSPGSLQALLFPPLIKQSTSKQGNARGASEVRRGTSSIHVHCPVPQSSSHIGMDVCHHRFPSGMWLFWLDSWKLHWT